MATYMESKEKNFMLLKQLHEAQAFRAQYSSVRPDVADIQQM